MLCGLRLCRCVSVCICERFDHCIRRWHGRMGRLCMYPITCWIGIDVGQTDGSMENAPFAAGPT